MAVYAICYLAAYFLARWEQYYLSGAVLLAVAAWLYYSDYRKTKKYHSSACPVFAFLDRGAGAVLSEAKPSADRLVIDDMDLSGSGLCRFLGSV